MDRENQEWKTIEPGVWKHEKEGDRIEGVLVNKIPADQAKGMSARYVLDTKAGLMTVWGSAIIDDRMQYVNVGEPVKIIYDGEGANAKGQKLNMFTVQTAKKKKEEADNTDTAEQDPVQVEDIKDAPDNGVATGADNKSENK